MSIYLGGRMLQKICAVLALFITTVSWAADAYNPTTNQLTAANVSAFGTTYTQVVLTVDKVLSVGGGAPQSSVDTYDDRTNQLTIASVDVKGTTYTNVVITVGQVLNVGGTLLQTPNGLTCASSNADVFGTMAFETSQPIRAKPWGCLVVNAADQQPTWDGHQAVRFEVRPSDCSASSSFDDCANDRSRHEINEAGIGPTQGQILTWEERIFIPSQPKFRPKGGNIMFLTQINFIDDSHYGTVAYIEVAPDGALMIRTHVDLTFNILRKYVVHKNPTDKWVKFKFEVKSTSQPDGYLKVYVDDQLVVDEVRPTLPTPTSVNFLKLGIYNAFKSQAIEPYGTQIVYFDGLSKTVKVP